MHNTVAVAISQLNYNLKVNQTSKFNYTTFGMYVSERGNHGEMENFLETLVLLQ